MLQTIDSAEEVKSDVHNLSPLQRAICWDSAHKKDRFNTTEGTFRNNCGFTRKTFIDAYWHFVPEQNRHQQTEEDLYMTLRKYHLGLSLRAMEADYFESKSTLAERYAAGLTQRMAKHRQLLEPRLQAENNFWEHLTLEEVHQHTSKEWKEHELAQKFECAFVVDVTMIDKSASLDPVISGQEYSRYKGGPRFAVLRLCTTTGFNIYTAGVVLGGEAITVGEYEDGNKIPTVDIFAWVSSNVSSVSTPLTCRNLPFGAT